MTHATLSVTTCNYNHGHLIGRAIEAVVSQSRLPDEYLILDDASTDNSLEIIEHYAAQYPFIRVLRNKQNLGVIESFQRLMDKVRGDYVFSGAADDYVLPGFFESAMQMADQHPQAGIIFGQVVHVSASGEKLKTISVDGWSQNRHLSPQDYLNQYFDVQHPGHSACSATVWKKSALVEVGGFRSELLSWTDTFAARAIGLKRGACYIPNAVRGSISAW